jgi:Dicarboxylate transport
MDLPPTSDSARSAQPDSGSDGIADGRQRDADQTLPATGTSAKPFVRKHFLQTGAGIVALVFGVGFATGAYVWSQRIPLGESALRKSLKERGIDSALQIDDLTWNEATVSALRLGSTTLPTLTLQKARVKWRVDLARGLLVVTSAQIDQPHLRLGLDKGGSLNFGALAPLLQSSGGRKQFVLEGVNLTNGQVSFLAPSLLGPFPLQAQIDLSGGESQGWQGLARVALPSDWQARPQTPSSSTPIEVGFAVRPSTRPDTLPLGIAVDFLGQSFVHPSSSLDISSVQGRYRAGVIIGPDGLIRVEGKAARLKVERFKAAGFAISKGVLDVGPLTWRHQGAWNKAASFTGQVAVEIASGKAFEGAGAFVTGPSQLAVSLNRQSDGSVSSTYAIKASQVRGAVQARSVRAVGKATGFWADLLAPQQARMKGQAVLETVMADVGGPILSQIPLEARPAVAAALQGISGDTALAFDVAGDRFVVSLNTPFQARAVNGARLAWTSGRQPTTITGLKRTDGSWQVSTLATGGLSLFAPGMGSIAAELDGFVQGPEGWAVKGRRGAFDQVNWGGLVVSGRLEAFEFSAKARQAIPTGIARGALTVRGRNQGVQVDGGSVRFDVKNTPVTAALNRVEAAVSGQFDRAASEAVSLAGGSLALAYRGTVSTQGQQIGSGVPISRGGWSGGGRINRLTGQGSDARDLAFSASGELTSGQGRDFNLVWSGNAQAQSTRTPGLALNQARLTTSGQADLAASTFAFAGRIGLEAARGSVDNGSFGGLEALWQGRGSGQLGFASGRRANSRPLALDVQGQTSARLTSLALGENGSTLSARDARVSGPMQAKIGPSADRWNSRIDLSLQAGRVVTGQTQLETIAIDGPITLGPSAGNGVGVSGARCLPLSARAIRSGDVFVEQISGSLCPDAAGRFASVSSRGVGLYGDARLQPALIRLGSAETGQTVQLSAVTADFKPGSNGAWALGISAPSLTFGFKLPDGTQAEIRAESSVLDVVPVGKDTEITATLTQITSQGLPVAIAGQGTGVFTSSAQGISGRFNFDGLQVVDVARKVLAVPRDETGTPTGPAQEVDALPRFGPLMVDGSGTYENGALTINAGVKEARTKATLASVKLIHDIATDRGRVDMASDAITFAPTASEGTQGLQPADVVPALRGVVLDAVGTLKGTAFLAWQADAPVVSGGSFGTEGISFDTLLGPVEGVRGQVTLSDLLTVRSAGTQIIDIKQFDPGLPIVGGTVSFELPGDNTLKLDDARWPFAGGTLSVQPAIWAFKDGDQRFAINVNDVDLAQFLRLTEVPNLEVDGRVSGVFPIEVRNGIVEIVGGSLKARDGGGMIRYTGPGTSSPPPPPTWLDRLRGRVSPAPPPEGADLAIAALRALEYRVMEITVNGRITGDLLVGILLEGANQQVLSGVPFRFNVRANVPVGQLSGMYNRTFGNTTLTEEALDLYRQQEAQDAQNKAPTTEPQADPPAPAPVPVPAPATVPAPAPTEPAPKER